VVIFRVDRDDFASFFGVSGTTIKGGVCGTAGAFVGDGVSKAHDHDLTISHTKEALTRIVNITVMLTLGWPLYLLMNVTGHKYPVGTKPNHFMPSSPIFADKERHLIVISDIGLVLTLLVLSYVWYLHGLSWLVYSYMIPYMIVNFWLVLITYLQHTDHKLPHYDNEHWDWLRGALATIDRDYGIMNVVLHHIADTHVVHHLFSSMPHYHAQEATAAVKKLLGDYYSYDNTPIARALWNSYGHCRVAEPSTSTTSKGVYWFN